MGKAISMDIMQVAKDALVSIEHFFEQDQNLVDSFPRLVNNNVPVVIALNHSSELPNFGISNLLEHSILFQGPELSDHGSEVNYLPHWLEHGFDVQQIPESLF
ncbi:uncharacterized protein KD926_002569 [Aspergillus affinis]|uniref:uncharacterized protein n=1 Tax=Aspergillus affinis TaxID=1070780 RepID=UPI0022FDEE12|nr:uncharacterized protein KD926_002569 [Aspergillus affinis]KAI9035957.1 hypothetical protein KD926_002569 [Aspergillus affinis]